MALSNMVVKLLSNAGRYQDDSGVWHDGEMTERTVYANQYSLGASTRSALLDMGLSAEAEVEVILGAYKGEAEAVYGGVQYDVISTSDTAGHTRLVLGRRINNG